MHAVGAISSDAFALWAEAYAELCAAERDGASPARTMELTEVVLYARVRLRRVRRRWPVFASTPTWPVFLHHNADGAALVSKMGIPSSMAADPPGRTGRASVRLDRLAS